MNENPVRNACHFCRRSFESHLLGPVPKPFRLLATLSLTPVHFGSFAWNELSENYCARCRAMLSFLSVALAATVAAVTVVVIRIVMNAGFFGMALEYWRNKL